MRKILGVLFIILGCLGGLLPIMPGFLFFFAGLALISPRLEIKMRNVHRRYQCHHSIKQAIKELIVELTPSFLKKNKSTQT